MIAMLVDVAAYYFSSIAVKDIEYLGVVGGRDMVPVLPFIHRARFVKYK